MRSRICVTVGCPSARLFVPPFDRSSCVWLVWCWAPCSRRYSGGRHMSNFHQMFYACFLWPRVGFLWRRCDTLYTSGLRMTWDNRPFWGMHVGISLFAAGDAIASSCAGYVSVASYRLRDGHMRNATTAENFGEDLWLGGWWFPSSFSFIIPPRLTLLLHPRFAHSFPCSSFRFPLNLAVKSGKHYIRFQRCPAKKMTAMVTKVGGGPNTLGPRDLPPPESWRGRVPWVPWSGCVYDDGGRMQNESIVPVAAATAAGVCCAILPCYTMKRVSSYSIS